MTIDERYISEAADRIMIHDLIGRYAFAIDYGTHDPRAWAELFVENGRFEIPVARVVVEGRAALRDFAAGLHRTLPGIHHVMSNIIVDVEGDRATGKCELNEFMVRAEAIYSVVQGWYEDEYVREQRRWRFAARKVFVTRDSSRVSTSGRIGEYTRAYFEFCRQYARASLSKSPLSSPGESS